MPTYDFGEKYSFTQRPPEKIEPGKWIVNGGVYKNGSSRPLKKISVIGRTKKQAEDNAKKEASIIIRYFLNSDDDGI